MAEGKNPGMNRRAVFLVIAISVVFLSLGGLLGLWSARRMQDQVMDEFNQAQLLMASHTAELIEREMNFLSEELRLLARDLSSGGFEPEVEQNRIQRSLSRTLERGVWDVEVVDLRDGRTYLYMPYQHWPVEEKQEDRLKDLPAPESLAEGQVWVSRPRVKSSGISLLLACRLSGPFKGLVLFNLNVSRFLSPFLKNLRPGKTGYAWLIDESGTFLFHPKSDFVGRNAFVARDERNPLISHSQINFIQKERMLKGDEGTSWYYSGWHHGITGQLKKLIAFYPVTVSDNPPQRWSIAAVAPISEIEEAVSRGNLRHFLSQGFIFVVVFAAATTILILLVRWSRRLEEQVQEKTEQYKRSEERYRSLVESAEDFIFTIDLEGCFQSMNSFTASFFGGRPEDFLGQPLVGLFPGGVAEEQHRLVKLVAESGKSVRHEFELPTGERKTWLSANFMPLKGRAGEVNLVLCIARDITENRRLEGQLINAEKLASIGTLAAGVAHEINNPLGVILGFCDLLVRKAEEGSQEHEDLKAIERQGLHCKQVVENLLSFARLGERKTEYSDLNSCLEEIIKVVSHTLEMNNVELSLELTRHIPPVRGDSRQLQQVFLNLINNALGAMKGGGRLTVRTFLERSTGKGVVQVIDDGVGIKEADLDHIYEPFFTTKPEGEGTGLGLFVSYGIIARHGGSIDCLSRTADSPGQPQGTTFTVKLPTRRRER